MSSYYETKKKKQRTVYIKPGSQLVDILRVLAVSGEIGCKSFPLFGVGGKSGKIVKAGEYKRVCLNEVEYQSATHESMFTGKAFMERGQGKEKTFRISSNATQLFYLVPGGQYYFDINKKNNLSSESSHVLRNIVLAEWCIFCMRSKVEFNPTRNPMLYNLSHWVEGSGNTKGVGIPESQPRPVSNTIFYPAREIKRRDGAASNCCKGSRTIGCLVKPEGVSVCYSLPDSRMVWNAQTESALNWYIASVFSWRNFEVPREPLEKQNALCIAKSYESAEKVVFEPPFVSEQKSNKNNFKRERESFKDVFRNVYVFPQNEDGIKQFKFFSIPKIHEKVLKRYVNPADIKAVSRTGYDCDGYDEKSNTSTLYFLEGCVTRLCRCTERAVLQSQSGVKTNATLRVVCFPWQTEYVKRKSEGADRVEIVELNYEEAYQSVFGMPNDERG